MVRWWVAGLCGSVRCWLHYSCPSLLLVDPAPVRRLSPGFTVAGRVGTDCPSAPALPPCHVFVLCALCGYVSFGPFPSLTHTPPPPLARRSPKSALTPKGVRQAAAVGAMLRARYGPSLSGVTAVYASPAVRAAGTATAALAAAGAPADHPITLAEELLEIDQGDWEDALREEIITPEVRAASQRDPGHHHAPGGESPAQVEERAAKFLFHRVIPDTIESVAAEAAAAAAGANGGEAVPDGGAAAPTLRADGLGGVVLVFTHGFVIKTLVRRVTGGSWDSVGRTHVSNGGAVEVGVTANEDLILLRCNDDAHVRGVV